MFFLVAAPPSMVTVALNPVTELAGVGTLLSQRTAQSTDRSFSKEKHLSMSGLSSTRKSCKIRSLYRYWLEGVFESFFRPPGPKDFMENISKMVCTV